MINNIQEWVVSTFGIDRNTSATILITLFVFVAGLFITLLFDAVKAGMIRRMRRRIVLLNIKDFIKEVGVQSGSYQKFQMQVTAMGDKTLAFLRSDISQISALKEVGYENMFSAFFPGFGFLNSKMRLRAFSKLWQIIEVISYWQARSFKDYEDFLIQYNQFNDKRNEALSGYLRFIEPILLEAHGQMIDATLSSFLNKVQAIHSNWQKQKSRRVPGIAHTTLVRPLLDLNKEYKNSIVLEMNRFLLASSLHYENIKNLKQNTADQFFFYFILFKAKRKLLHKIQEILGMKTTKKINWGIVFSILLAAIALIVSVRSCDIANKALVIGKHQFKDTHRPELRLRHYASYGTDLTLKGTMYEDSTGITGTYWITNKISANTVLKEIQVPAGLQVIGVFVQKRKQKIPYSINPGEEVLVLCRLESRSKDIKKTEEALKQQVTVHCSDEIGTNYLCDFIWMPEEGSFSGCKGSLIN